MSEKIKVFYALQGSANYTQHLFAQLLPLRKALQQAVHWLPPDHFHITVKFIGFIAETHRDAIVRCLTSAIAMLPPPAIHCEKILPFPNPTKPRVLAALVKPTQALQQLFQLVDDGLQQEGISKDKRPFLPHMTVARVRNFSCPHFDPLNLHLSSMPVTALTLFQSISTGHGSFYQPLAQLPFQSSQSSEQTH